ncbi:uncharacterized conserved protein [Longilinea arvoryzae]|uniref:Uncharacterized conserved protein n=1 Tax=Longilinea arvoryzae TaxID=360412 RepID=A0A0S7BLB8_9CHLR|nr:antibiotic biosynthesis monooxygenase [Longilinea arvoryzae]GAP14763.1 uncharacterized conserved protein [Longilinea arvoryzae]
MHIVLVDIHVKPEFLDEFKKATLDNARNSIQEAGVMRFDALQQKEDACRFVLVEVYRQREDQAAHRETAHYIRWRDAVAPMMAEPRVGRIFENVYPDDDSWGKA